MNINKKERLIILLEAYFSFNKEGSTIASIYDWLSYNKIHGHQYYNKSDIITVMRHSHYFTYEKGKPGIWRMEKYNRMV